MQTHKVLLRQLAVDHQGNGEEYEYFKKMIEASPLLYKHDFHVYNDGITTRHHRNIAELSYIQSLIKNRTITPQMLSTNIYNAFYPSYVLANHYSVFLRMLIKLRDRSEITQILKAASQNQITGAFFHETRSIDIKDNTKKYPRLDDKGIINMQQNTFFYSSVTSPYITHAAFLSQDASGQVLTIVAVREQKGQFYKGVKTIDFGATISSDYLPIGYNFSGVKPLLVLNLEPKIMKNIQSIHLQQYVTQFNYSLKDFQKSLWITIKYTAMRRQFKTLANSKQERRIITYQAVANRIINAFCQFQAFSDLYARMLSEPQRYKPINDLLNSSHHVILQHLIHLRECCGGFGFMQVSGHPGCMERVSYRAGNQAQEHLKTQRDYLKAIQFYTGSQQIQQFFLQALTDPSVSYMQFFSVFLSICKNMRQNKQQITPSLYRRQFLKQTSIFAMHARQQILKYEGNNIHCQLLQYLLLGYILRNIKFTQWELIKIEREVFFEQLNIRRTAAFQQISKELLNLGCTLELTYLRNTIVGRQDQQEFYKELIQTSKANLRNSKQYRDYVRQPISQVIIENRARL